MPADWLCRAVGVVHVRWSSRRHAGRLQAAPWRGQHDARAQRRCVRPELCREVRAGEARARVACGAQAR